ncbi:nuclease-related domain-containing protein [Actinospica durhamensis]|uniref:nuclease-related domain-containing protein n=1 Tax=Actinospica durhamensis TaxID=1508375 RepID=UPI0034D3CF6A
MKRSGADIDHIVIGPPGIFTINTKHHRDARIWVGEHALAVNGAHKPYLPRSRSEAASASRILSGAVGAPVAVTPVLAFVGASSISLQADRGDVLIARGEDNRPHTATPSHSVLGAGTRPCLQRGPAGRDLARLTSHRGWSRYPLPYCC